MSEHMKGNPHYVMNAADMAGSPDGRSITEATLALAWEQRTANMLALANSQYANGQAMFPAETDDAHQQIRDRLGITDEHH